MSDALAALWRIAGKDPFKLHGGLPKFAWDFPHTVSFVIRARQNIDSFYELPKDKRPPEDIWFNSDELEDWFDRVFKHQQTEIVITDVEE